MHLLAGNKEQRMYPFRIVQLEEGGFRFDLDGIRLLISGYNMNNGRHFLTEPEKAFGYFTNDFSVYSISNATIRKQTAEDLFDTLLAQYKHFRSQRTATN